MTNQEFDTIKFDELIKVNKLLYANRSIGAYKNILLPAQKKSGISPKKL